MKTYKIPVSWSMYGEIEVQAENIEDAILEAEDAPLPDNGEYMSGSFMVDEDMIRFFNPNMNCTFTLSGEKSKCMDSNKV